MLLLKMVFEAILLTAGGFAVTAGVIYVTWNAFKLTNHPEWGPPVGFAIMLFVYVEETWKSELLVMSLILTFVSCLAAWPVGAEWRGRKKLHRLFADTAPVSRGPLRRK